MTKASIQKLVESDRKKVFNDFIQKIKNKQNLELPCVAHQMNFKGNKIKEEKDKTPHKCSFLETRLGEELVGKLNRASPLSTQDCFRLSLFFSLNDLLNFSSEEKVKVFFDQLKAFLDLLQKYNQTQLQKFLRIFQDKLAWEFFEFFEHVKNKNIRVEHLPRITKLICSLSLMFELEHFDQLEAFRNVLHLMQWPLFDFLFPRQTTSASKNIWTEGASQTELRRQTVLSRGDLEGLVETLLNFLTIHLLEEPKLASLSPSKISLLRTICSLMEFVWKLNQHLSVDVKLQEEQFLNSFLSDDFKFKECFLFYIRNKILTEKRYLHLRKKFQKEPPFGSFNFLNFPFLYSVERKVDILYFESTLEQHFNFRENFSIMTILRTGRLSLGLDLVVSRENLLEDALTQLTKNSMVKNLKKPLKVSFRGEPGMDEGGLTKEFFHLITQQLFDPKFGMFTIKNKSFWWLEKDSISCNLNFELIGMLMGLAIYNKTLLDLKFPLALYKKLIIEHNSRKGLEMSPKDFLGLADLQQVDPQLFSTLSNILNMDLPPGNDFGITFEITFESWGIRKNFLLIPDGDKVPVSNSNKHLFVEKYLDWFFNVSIEKQFRPFSVGFFKVLGDSVLQIFSAEDLLMTICGRTHLDFSELEGGSTYHDGFSKDSPTVLHFWKILLEEFNQEDKQRFLKFLTGNDRAPLRGLKEIKMKISK